jgi:hypothetical protein
MLCIRVCELAVTDSFLDCVAHTLELHALSCAQISLGHPGGDNGTFTNVFSITEFLNRLFLTSAIILKSFSVCFKAMYNLYYVKMFILVDPII